MKKFVLTLFIPAFLHLDTARASVTLSLEFGELTTSQSVALPSGSLWAMISEDSSGNLPGGLLVNSALSANTDTEAILADFAGAMIAPGELIGGGVVVATGSSLEGEISSLIQFTTSDFAALGLNQGDKFGIFWFPGRTTSSNTLPTDSDFEIGGFHQATSSVASGGTSGMSIPADSANLTVAYFDSVTTGGATSFDPALFQAVTVPEPSSLFLVSAAAMFALRRRR